MTEAAPQRSGLWIYFLLANIITWLGWIPALLITTHKGYPLPTIDYLTTHSGFQFVNAEHFWLTIAFTLAVYGPFIGACAALWRENGKQGLLSLWQGMIHWRIAPRWIWIIVGMGLGFPLLAVGIGLLTGNAAFQTPIRSFSGFFILGLFLYQFVTSGMEEPGWRGYLLSALAKRCLPEKVPVYLGLAWAVWHYPVTIYFTLQSLSQVTPIQALITILLALAGQTVSLIGMTYLYVWLMYQTNSLLLASSLHALQNTANAVLFALFAAKPMVTLLTAILPWVLVFILEKKLGKENFPGQFRTI
jgi:membrane protease YdiL (CAAX protease family)